MKVGDVVQYKSNAFTGIAPGSYGAGIIISIKDPVVDFDTGKVWSNKVVNVLWSAGGRTWDTKCMLEVINEGR